MSQRKNYYDQNDNRSNAYQYQQQQQLQYDDQIQQQEIRYAIFKDLEFVLVILAQTKTVLDYFQNDQENPMIRVSFNRLITQLNLSNSIHYDQFNSTCNNKGLRNELDNCKSQARLLFKQLTSDFKNNQQLRQFCDYYLNSNLADSNTTSKIIPLQQISTLQFQNQHISQNILESIMSSISHIDGQYNYIKNGYKIQQPSAFEIKQTMINKQIEAKQKLEYNFQIRQQSANMRANSVDNFLTKNQLSQSNSRYEQRYNQYSNYNKTFIKRQ